MPLFTPPLARAVRPLAAGEPPRSLWKVSANIRAGCPSHARPAHRWLLSEERYVRECSTAVSSVKRSLKAKDKQPEVGSAMPRPCIWPALPGSRRPSTLCCMRTRLAGLVRLAGARHTPGNEYESVALVVLHGRSGKQQKPNPSVEGTCNGGACWFALRALAAPSHAPHVKR